MIELNRKKYGHPSIDLIPAKRRLITFGNRRVRLRSQQIPHISLADLFKYLGMRFYQTCIQQPNKTNLTTGLGRIKRAPLKPWQKLELVKTYLLPRFFYPIQTPAISNKSLDMADKAIRRYLKEILRLPSSTSNAFFYADQKSGGLGILCFSARMPDILLSRLDKLFRTDDPSLRNYIDTPNTVRLASKLADMWHPYGTQDKQKGYWRSRLEATVSCAGLAAHSNPTQTAIWIHSAPSGYTTNDSPSRIEDAGQGVRPWSPFPTFCKNAQ